MHFAHKIPSNDNIGHDESLTVSRSGNVYNIEFKSETTVKSHDHEPETKRQQHETGESGSLDINEGESSSGGNSKSSSSPSARFPPMTLRPPIQHPTDTLLLKIMEKMDLDSLSISVSGGTAGMNFPVGTAVQFSFVSPKRSAFTSTSTTGDGRENEEDMELEFASNLLRILSFKNLLCENVQLDTFHNGQIRPVRMPFNVSTSGSTASSFSASSTLIVLPNDAFSLCHSQTLMNKIISSSPCRDFVGIYSQLNANLNEVDIVDRAIWIHISRNNNKSDSTPGIIKIEKGLRFGRIVNQNAISLARLLGGEVEGDLQMQHCPLAKSSKIIVRNENDGGEDGRAVAGEHDLKTEPMDMLKHISLGDHKVSKNKFGIERMNERLHGMANDGVLRTRVYYGIGDEDEDAGSGDCSADEIGVNIVDVYPKVISPIFHSIKISLVEGSGAGSDLFVANPSAPPANYTSTQLALDDLSHHLDLSADGSAALYLSTRIPRGASLYVELYYRPKYLEFERFPADPNRGFDVPPSIANFVCQDSTDRSNKNINGIPQTVPIFTPTPAGINIYSNALLIMPPVPDLSMPFNVISIASTFFALIIGTFMNLTIRKSRQKITDKLKGTKPLSTKEKIMEKVKRIKSKFQNVVKISSDGKGKQKAE